MPTTPTSATKQMSEKPDEVTVVTFDIGSAHRYAMDRYKLAIEFHRPKHNLEIMIFDEIISRLSKRASTGRLSLNDLISTVEDARNTAINQASKFAVRGNYLDSVDITAFVDTLGYDVGDGTPIPKHWADPSFQDS